VEQTFYSIKRMFQFLSQRKAKYSSRTNTLASTTLTREHSTTSPLPSHLEPSIPKKSTNPLLTNPSYFRSGVYKPPTFPYTLGREGSGTIISTGANAPSDLTPGTRVAYMGQSAYAEYTAAPANYTIPIPDSISTKTAAASLLQALTAVTLIRDAYEVQKGDWVLVTAAAGGVGLWLCQSLKSVGARVIATASTEEKRALAKENGAEFLLAYEDVPKKVMEITNGEGVHAVFDSVGKSTFDGSLSTVRRKGTMVSFGNASGSVEGFALA
jgi:NADPH2:quinone reductase